MNQQEKFLKTTLGLISLIRELVSEAYEKGYKTINPILLDGASGYIADMNRDKLIDDFIYHSYPHWTEIKNMNEIFFNEHAGKIFGDLPMSNNNINAFRQLFSLVDESGKPIIDPSDKKSIWDFFHSMVKICIHHVINTRKIDQSSFDYIDLKKSCTVWSIK